MAQLIELADVEDYTQLFGDTSDTKRLNALLKAASGYLLSKLKDYERGSDPVLDSNATTVVCSMVNRALSAPQGMSGVSSFTQTAGPYSASVSMLDQYMRPLPSELELLGLTSGGIYSVHMGAK